MKKVKLIIGEERSGKSFLSRGISLGFENPVVLDGRHVAQSAFPFQMVNKDTDLIVVDGVEEEFFLDVMLTLLSDEIQIEKQSMAPFKMKTPHVVVVSNVKYENLSLSAKRRCNIVRTWIESDENSVPIFCSERLTD